jgi:hypothetical protein
MILRTSRARWAVYRCAARASLNSLVAALVLASGAVAEAQTVVPVMRFPSQLSGEAPGIDARYVAVATYVAKVAEAHQVCWTNPNYLPDDGDPKTKPVEDKAMQLAHRRYRIEGGAVQTSTVLAFKDWTQAKMDDGRLIPMSYCTLVAGPPAAGHWVYEIQMCRDPFVSEDESCSEWVSSLSPYSGAAQERPQGWWVYSFGDAIVEPPPPSACKVAPNSSPIFKSRPVYGLKADGTLEKSVLIGRVPVGTECDCSDKVLDHYSVTGRKSTLGDVLPAKSYALCVEQP